MGMITEIQRFSLKDGPGIRSTVFFKGCNASCRWCHNPETLSLDSELLIYPERCAGCGACVGFDRARAGRGLPPPREELSWESAALCFSGALQAAGAEMNLSQVLDQLEQDKDYYLASGGGVTLSGGELMMQAGFAAEILRACREKGIAAAIETNLAYDYALLEGLLPCLDLVMADIKALDEGRHRAFTGIGNGVIRENAARLAKTGLPYIIRSPVIPGFNDNRADIKAIAAFVRGLGGNLLYYELLGFNPLGDSKYRALGRENPYGGARLLDDGAMEALAAAAAETGIPVRRG